MYVLSTILLKLCLFLFQAGLNMMMHRLADDLQPKGIMCALLDPGWVKTKLLVRDHDQATITTEESIRGLLKAISEMNEEQNGLCISHEGKINPF